MWFDIQKIPLKAVSLSEHHPVQSEIKFCSNREKECEQKETVPAKQ